MQTIDVHEAAIDLSELIDKAANGETFIIARAGKPIVQVTAVALSAAPSPEFSTDAPKKSRIGFLKGQIHIPDDFDTMFQDEMIRMFEGEE